ncbi:MAG: response regulator transcription factor [Candidatus Eremiobacterota bacterium]
MGSVRVFLVDDHPLVRHGLRAVLASDQDVVVVGEASNGREAVEKMLALPPESSPDLVVMDLQMPEMDGLEATRQLKEVRPDTAVLILTVNNSEMFLLEAVRAGAAGYLLKDTSSEMLLPTIRALVQGASLIPADLLQKAVRAQATRVSDGDVEPLTERELEILRMLARGMAYQEIADTLSLAYVTVKKHSLNVVAKLGVSDRTQAVLKAVRLGLVEV